MTEREAIEVIMRNKDTSMIETVEQDEFNIALNLAIAALEKQIGRKPNDGTDNWTDKPKCGVCHRHIKYVYGIEYCPACGNEIDWSEEE